MVEEAWGLVSLQGPDSEGPSHGHYRFFFHSRTFQLGFFFFSNLKKCLGECDERVQCVWTPLLPSTLDTCIPDLPRMPLVGAGCREERGLRMERGPWEACWLLFASRSSTFSCSLGHGGLHSCLPRYVPLPPGQFVHCPSSLPAAEAWEAHAFSQLSPESGGPVQCGWVVLTKEGCPGHPQADCLGAWLEFQTLIGWWLW